MTPSNILQSVIDQLKQREELGLNKYGTTLDRTDLTQQEWLEHAKQEAMDLVLYLEKALQNVKKEPEKTLSDLENAEYKDKYFLNIFGKVSKSTISSKEFCSHFNTIYEAENFRQHFYIQKLAIGFGLDNSVEKGWLVWLDNTVENKWESPRYPTRRPFMFVKHQLYHYTFPTQQQAFDFADFLNANNIKPYQF